jgi:hypothetical protein
MSSFRRSPSRMVSNVLSVKWSWMVFTNDRFSFIFTISFSFAQAISGRYTLFITYYDRFSCSIADSFFPSCFPSFFSPFPSLPLQFSSEKLFL